MTVPPTRLTEKGLNARDVREPLPMRAVVVLQDASVGAHAAMPGKLLEGLGARGLAVQVVADGASAMTSLAATPAIAVLLVEPAAHAHASELFDALRTYHPRTACWVYLPAGDDRKPRVMNYEAWAELVVGGSQVCPQPPLGDPAVADRSAVEIEHGPLPFVLPRASPPETLAEEGLKSEAAADRLQKLLVRVKPEQERSAAVVSEEELSMLLGPVPGEVADHG